MSVDSSHELGGRPADSLMPVVEYVRMSTDHQKYSTQNQSDVIRSYADKHGMRIVETFRDEGKSGLNIEGRDALRQMIEVVQGGGARFQAILVYDVSRWGRFQNTDEAAYYEYLCTRAGIRVIYCAEPFENDGSPLATIYKGIKRSMAGEYSRELSTKVFAGHCRLVKLGFHQGGPAGYGLRRALLNECRELKGELAPGQHKSIQTDRVILVPGPATEIAVVHQIYSRFIDDGYHEQQIADELNTNGVKTDLGRTWTRELVHQILVNEKYIGNNVYNRTSVKLRQPMVRNSPDQWVRCEGAFEGIISVELFEQARRIIVERSQRYDDAKMLEMLRGLLERAGALSGLLIDEQPDMPSSSAYIARFGGLTRAYTLIGYSPGRDYHYIQVNRQLRQWQPKLVDDIVGEIEAVGARVRRNPETDLLTVNDEWTASVIVVVCKPTAAGASRWRMRFDTGLVPDVTVAVRLAPTNDQVQDYYLIPRLDMGAWPSRLGEENNSLIDSYRFDSLDVLVELASQCSVEEAVS